MEWILSNMSRTFYSEGAPTPTFLSNNTTVEFMAFTSNDNATNNTDIWLINNTSANPSGIGSPMPPPITTSNNEDNPHIVRLNGNNLVLFFDSDNLQGGEGDIDLWYSQSNDNGTTWSIPKNVSAVNTSNKEHQPFLHQEDITNKWYLYYSAYHTDGKLAIYRSEQDSIDNWNSWKTPELVISAGNAAGIGEPTVTNEGDISFVVVYEDTALNSTLDRFDSDPWMVIKKKSISKINHEMKKEDIHIYPTLTKGEIIIRNNLFHPKLIAIYNSYGQVMVRRVIVENGDSITFDLTNYDKGIYLVKAENSHEVSVNKIIKQ